MEYMKKLLIVIVAIAYIISAPIARGSRILASAASQGAMGEEEIQDTEEASPDPGPPPPPAGLGAIEFEIQNTLDIEAMLGDLRFSYTITIGNSTTQASLTVPKGKKSASAIIQISNLPAGAYTYSVAQEANDTGYEPVHKVAAGQATVEPGNAVKAVERFDNVCTYGGLGFEITNVLNLASNINLVFEYGIEIVGEGTEYVKLVIEKNKNMASTTLDGKFYRLDPGVYVCRIWQVASGSNGYKPSRGDLVGDFIVERGEFKRHSANFFNVKDKPGPGIAIPEPGGDNALRPRGPGRPAAFIAQNRWSLRPAVDRAYGNPDTAVSFNHAFWLLPAMVSVAGILRLWEKSLSKRF